MLAVAATFALYEIVRRVNVLRFLLGMRPRRRGAGGAVEQRALGARGLGRSNDMPTVTRRPTEDGWTTS